MRFGFILTGGQNVIIEDKARSYRMDQNIKIAASPPTSQDTAISIASQKGLWGYYTTQLPFWQ
jgi:hypothetical protein